MDPKALEDGTEFGIQYIDAMRNEYIQVYELKSTRGQVNIECGYPEYLEQV